MEKSLAHNLSDEDLKIIDEYFIVTGKKKVSKEELERVLHRNKTIKFKPRKLRI